MTSSSTLHTLQARSHEGLSQVGSETVMTALRESGAVLLRGFGASLAGFQQFTQEFCDRFHHVGTRRAVHDPGADGYTSEVSHLNFNLFVHAEGTYRPCPPPPDLGFFHCVRPPARGGETLLADGVRFLRMLPEDLRRRFQQHGIIYQAVWDTPRWQTEFQVQRLAEVDALLRDHPGSGYRMAGDDMVVRCRTPAIRNSLGGEPAFANGLLAHLPAITHPRWRSEFTYSKATNRVFFGDGDEIGTVTINALIDIQDEIALAHGWRADDLLILDNRRFMHGRLMSDGDCERRIRSRFGQLGRELQADRCSDPSAAFP